jgi:hypothetical protein
MKKMGHFSLPSALHKKPTVMRNLFDFLPDICLDAKPRSGGALLGLKLLSLELETWNRLTIQTGLTRRNPIGLSLDISQVLPPTVFVLLQQQQDPQIRLHHASGVLADRT